MGIWKKLFFVLITLAAVVPVLLWAVVMAVQLWQTSPFWFAAAMLVLAPCVAGSCVIMFRQIRRTQKETYDRFKY